MIMTDNRGRLYCNNMICIRYNMIPTRIAVLTFHCSIFSYLLPKQLIFDIITVIHYNTFLHNI